MVSYAWGGVQNGRIPADRMTSIGGGNLLRDDAATQFLAFAAGFRAVFGKELLVSEGYRDYATQVSLKNYWTSLGQPYKAATPGGSIHGWGLAIDIYSWVYGGSTGTVEHKWLRENGPSYGFDWYATGEPIDEPWHFDYIGGATITGTTTIPLDNISDIKRKAADMLFIKSAQSGRIALIGEFSGRSFAGADFSFEANKDAFENIIEVATDDVLDTLVNEANDRQRALVASFASTLGPNYDGDRIEVKEHVDAIFREVAAFDDPEQKSLKGRVMSVQTAINEQS